MLCLPVYGDSDKLYKAFIVLYTCTSTTAVLLDAVHNATVDAFISSFKRFIARRGAQLLLYPIMGPFM